MQILDGKTLAKLRETLLKKRVEEFRARQGRAPGLAVVLVGDDPASQIYVRNKELACERTGIHSTRHNLASATSQKDLDHLIDQLNHEASIDGILVQMPLPKGLSGDRVIERISPLKDPDGFTYENLGLLMSGRKRVAACTPQGVMEIFNHYHIDVQGKSAVVVGRSNTVGKPMAQLLVEANATVTVCHSKTVNLSAYTRLADIVVVAAGRAHLLGKVDFKAGAVVVDVGMHRLPNGRLTGDVNPDGLEGHVAALTPVPGGVGPMTISCLLENTIILAEQRAGHP